MSELLPPKKSVFDDVDEKKANTGWNVARRYIVWVLICWPMSFLFSFLPLGHAPGAQHVSFALGDRILIAFFMSVLWVVFWELKTRQRGSGN